MKYSIRRTLAALMALSCTAALASVLPASADVTQEAQIIYATDFEDGDVSKFSKRGDTDTSVISAATDADAPNGPGVMAVTGRSNGWNGPQFRVDEVCEPGVKYTVSVWVKAAWYNNCMLSMQYTDEAGEQHYSNLSSAVSQGDWVQIPETAFSYSENMKDVYIYVECGDGTELYIDDFVLKAAPVYDIEQDIPGLKDVYADYFKIGGAVTADELSPNATKELIKKHYNSITLGNELKPENMLDQAACQAAAASGDNTQVAVSLKGAARTILNFCRDNNIPVRGHVLVWHSQTPDWFFKEKYDPEGDFVDKDTMLARMENYIKGVMEVIAEEYSDVDFYAWDVVNEAWLDDGNPRQPGEQGNSGSAKSAWVQVFGDNSFIPYAFEYARKYAPEGCKLYYNDFNEYMPGKTDAIVQMAEELKEKGLIDGIGMQSHLAAMNNGTDPFPGISAYRKALEKFAATGLDVQVTELDATVKYEGLSEDEIFELQAQYYSDIMDAIVEFKDSISAVVFWGTTDDMSWRASGSPLLFNEDYTAKPAFYAIIDGLDYDVPETTEPATDETTEPDSDETTEPATDETTAPDTSEQDNTTEAPDTSESGNTLLGDVDESGVVDIVDVVALNKNLMLGTEISAQGTINADVDKNGTVNATDSLNILKYTVKIIPNFDSIQ